MTFRHKNALRFMIVLLSSTQLASCGGGGGSQSNVIPGYLTASYFPFNVGDVYKYRTIDSTTSTPYLTEVDIISVTNSDYLVRYTDNTGTYDEVDRIGRNNISAISSTDSAIPQGFLPLTLYDLSLSENVAKTVSAKSNLAYPDVDNDGIPEIITTWTASQTLLPKETVTIESIHFADCAKIKTIISFNMTTSTGAHITTNSTTTEWFASAIGRVKTTDAITMTGPGGVISTSLTDELLKYDVGGIKGGDWTPPSITANAATLTNKLQIPVSGITEIGATVSVTTTIATSSVASDSSGNYLVNATLAPNTSNSITVSASDFVKNVNTLVVSVIQDSIPPAPVTIVASPITGSVNLSWNASSDANGIAEYRVVNNSLPLGRTTGTAWSDTSVNPGEKVTYQVLAVDNAGNASLPNTTFVSIPPGGTGVFNTQYQLTWPAIVGSLQWDTPSLFIADINSDGNRDVTGFSQNTGTGEKFILTTLGPISAASQFSVTMFTPFDTFVTPQLFSDINNDSQLEIMSPTGGINMGPRILNWVAASSAWSDIPQPTWTTPGVSVIGFADIDGDGVLDAFGSDSRYYKGIVGGGFDNNGISVTGINSLGSSMKFSDLNRDGRVDIVVWDNTNIKSYLNQGSSTYLLASTLPTFSCVYFRCNYLVADITGDGFPDIIYDDVPGASRDVRIFINDGTGHFPATSVATNIGTSWEFTTGDLNGDGIPDLIVEDGGITATVWKNNGNVTFTAGPAFPVSYYDKVIATDIDRDGKVDVVTYGGGFNVGSEIKIFLNQ